MNATAPADTNAIVAATIYFSDFALALCAFTIVASLGRPALSLLRRLSFKQNAYEDAPKTHAVKTGTPTMGGLLFALVLIVYELVVLGYAVATRFAHADASFMRTAFALPLLGIACAAIGFVDDYASIVRGRNKGLGAREKFGATALVAIAFLTAIAGHVPTQTLAIGHFAFGVPAWLWYGLSFVAILSTTHAVNLTDGLDGLASGTLLAPLALLIYIACSAAFTFAAGSSSSALIAGSVDAVTLGAVLGFLIYNKHPARVFMGDTGSLLLGGILAGSAIMLDQQLLLPLIGGVFAAEALSVIIQVAYFKRTGKRIFRMSPLHHHFELAGWPETKVTARFWLASLALSLLGLATTFAPRAAS
jgi:phospho-N-acetylmuramoyl-pentapeptide-transferase